MTETPPIDLLDTAAAGPAAIRGGIVRVVGFVLGALVSLVSVAILFRHLGVRDSGRYVTIQSIALMAAGITDAGLLSIGVREFAVTEGTARQTMLRDLLGLRIVLTGIGGLVAVIFVAAAGYGGGLVAGAAISSLGMLLVTLQHAYGIGLNARLAFGRVTLAEFIRQIVSAAAVVALVVAGARLLPFFLATVIGSAVALVAVVRWRGSDVPLRPSWSPSRWRRLLADTLMFSIASAIAQVYFRLAVVLVSLIASREQAGYFSASFRAVEVAIAVPALLVGAAFPVLARAARDDHDRLAYATSKIIDVSVIAGAAIALLFAVGAEPIMQVVGGHAFVPAAPVLRVHGVSLALSFVGAGLGYTVVALRLHLEALVCSLAALVATLVLVPVLAHSNGAVGAAIGTTIAEGILTVSLGVAVHRAGVRLSLDARGLLRAAAALAVGLVPALLTGLPASVRAGLCLVVYAVALVLLRALPQELRELVPRRSR